MNRRHFMASTAACSVFPLVSGAAAASTPVPAMDSKPREYYQLRRYSLQQGPQPALTERYFAEALIPALGRMGLGPIGAFSLNIGPETPSYYLLIPSDNVETLALVDQHLSRDAEFLKAAEFFWNAPATAPSFLRVEASLHVAFEGWPRIVKPAASTGKGKRIFQLRTYESPSYSAHVRKVEMFHSGEFEIFKNAGFHSVFFGDTLVGPRQPSLTYMLSFADMAELGVQWAAFGSDPAWKKLSTDPRFAYEEIVSNITNLVLSPLSSSQI
jgi:hypothetical protein